MLLVSGATATMRRVRNRRLGRLLRPGNGNGPDELPWAVDNGAFAGFDAQAFVSLLDRIKGKPGCLWVAAPDVVGNACATADRYREWEPELRGRGLPVAFVAQDGLDDPPWDRLDCLFIGGSTEYKLGAHAAKCMREAKRRGKWVHMGRVNTVRRLRYAFDMGVDSVDGTQFSMFPDRWIPWALSKLEAMERQVSINWGADGTVADGGAS